MNGTISHPSFGEPRLSIANIAKLLDISVQAVHKKLKEKNIQCPKIGNRAYINHQIARQLLNLDFKPKKIAVQLVKGGVGKTTTLLNVAACGTALGAKILLVDLDPQGNLTDACNVDSEEIPVLIDVFKGEAKMQDIVIPLSDGLDLIPSRIENVILDSEIMNKRLPIDKIFTNILSKIDKQYDFVLIDCPPTLSHSVTGAGLYADLLLVPLNPDKFSAKGLKILKEEISTLNENFDKNIDYRVFLNKFSAKTILSDKAVHSILNDPDLENRALRTTVPYTQEIPNLTDDNKNLFTTLKKSSTRDDFFTLTQELLEISSNDISNTNPHNLLKDNH